MKAKFYILLMAMSLVLNQGYAERFPLPDKEMTARHASKLRAMHLWDGSTYSIEEPDYRVEVEFMAINIVTDPIFPDRHTDIFRVQYEGNVNWNGAKKIIDFRMDDIYCVDMGNTFIIHNNFDRSSKIIFESDSHTGTVYLKVYDASDNQILKYKIAEIHSGFNPTYRATKTELIKQNIFVCLRNIFKKKIKK